MKWLTSSTIRRAVLPNLPAPAAPTAAEQGVDEAMLAMATTILYALEACDGDAALAQHCHRVMSLASILARRCGVAAMDAAFLEQAARLHEVGRIGVAPRAACGEDREAEAIRAHAAIGAHIVRRTQDEQVGWLIEEQYADYETLCRRLTPSDPRVLLAGILRVADVAETLAPRPGDAAETENWAYTVLTRGRGTRFHPAAVDAWAELYAPVRPPC